MEPVERLTYSVAEAARALGVSRSTLWRLIKNETVKPKKIGKRTLIRRADIVELLK